MLRCTFVQASACFSIVDTFPAHPSLIFFGAGKPLLSWIANYAFRLWKDLWNPSKLGCGSKLSEGFLQNDVFVHTLALLNSFFLDFIH